MVSANASDRFSDTAGKLVSGHAQAVMKNDYCEQKKAGHSPAFFEK